MKYIKFIYFYFRFKSFEKKIKSNFSIEFNKTKRVTLYYLGCLNFGGDDCSEDCLDYAFYKAYDLWGIDSLVKKEKEIF